MISEPHFWSGYRPDTHFYVLSSLNKGSWENFSAWYLVCSDDDDRSIKEPCVWSCAEQKTVSLPYPRLNPNPKIGFEKSLRTRLSRIY